MKIGTNKADYFGNHKFSDSTMPVPSLNAALSLTALMPKMPKMLKMPKTQCNAMHLGASLAVLLNLNWQKKCSGLRPSLDPK